MFDSYDVVYEYYTLYDIISVVYACLCFYLFFNGIIPHELYLPPLFFFNLIQWISGTGFYRPGALPVTKTAVPKY